MDDMKKYNILFITSDQQHYNTIGKFNPEIKTPNLDKLCEGGTYFDRAYTVNPTCTPTRASWITGLYPSQHGAWTLGTKLNETIPTIGSLMQENKIRTALIGKAHFQPLKATEEYTSLESYPILQDQEFWKNYNEDFYGFETVKLARNHTNEAHVGQHYVEWLERKGCNNWRDYFLPPTGNMDKEIKYKWKIPERYHYNTWIAEETIHQMEEYKESGEQFFLCANFFDPHPDYLIAEEYVDMYDPDHLTLPHLMPGELERGSEFLKISQEENPDISSYYHSGYELHGLGSHLKSEAEERKDMAVYYAMVTLMDKYIGKILERLKELDMEKETIVVFSTDHGNYIGQHGLTAKGPFLYEDGIRVPLIVKCPQLIPENRVCSGLQSAVDLPVTFLHYTNTKILHSMTGLNQAEVWEGKAESVRVHIICEHNHERNVINMRAYVDEQYKIVLYQDKIFGELYDLKVDPNEWRNLWDDFNYAQLKERLLMKYIWAELKKESLFMPRIADA